MREIKFRAYAKQDADRMLYSNELFLSEDFEPLQDSIDKFQNDYYLMQYTGLKDKNGKEIYEGDILSHENYTNRVVVYNETYGRYELETWNKCRYKFNDFNKRNCAVIGNIYENLDLLET